MEKDKERLKVLEKIDKFEIEGTFDIDPEDDPPTIPINKGEVDFLRKKLSSKVKASIANKVASNFFNKLIKEKKEVIKNVNGLENFDSLKDTGYIITCNHFNPFDTFTIEKIFKENNKRKKLYKVIREGNYTNFPGFYGFLMKNCNTLPLSENKHVLKELLDSIEILLEKNEVILIFPEQSMWWNYRKPKPLKTGAFNIACRNNVPILPIFITMEDTDMVGDDGFKIQAYTVNINPPIYPDENLSKKERMNSMLDKNYEIWKKVYEEFYNTPLKYKTKR